MTAIDTLVQPSEYRAEGAPPEWVLFPTLRLIFGWGDGLWETLGKEGMGAIRTAFAFSPHDKEPSGLLDFIRWLRDYDANRPPMPFYARVLTAIGCELVSANAICEGAFADGQGEDALHLLEADPDYRVRHGVSEKRYAYLSLERRAKKLKTEYVEMKRAFETHYSTVRHPGKKRSEAEQLYAARVEAMKAEYIDRRYRELLADASKRPPRFPVIAALQERVQMQKVLSGRFTGPEGSPPHRLFTPDELIDRTAHSVASTEATEMMFDYDWTRVCAFSEDGFTATAP